MTFDFCVLTFSLTTVQFFNTHVSPRAAELTAEVLRSTFLSEGETVARFETELGRIAGLTNAVAVNSGTSALHLALVVAGVGPGDEVILPAQTFIATGLTILMQGAIPVFADIQRGTGNIDPASIAKKITPKTRAIMPVHWAGYPCDMDEINALATQHKLAVIEDAAHALGATYRGRKVGSLSRFTAFSFQAIKHITTGDGGAIACRDLSDYNEARRLRWFGIDREHDKMGPLGERLYNLTDVGYKYHLNNLAAAVGLGNLPDLPAILARRRQIAAQYRQAFASVPGVTLLDSQPDRESAQWVFTLIAERRDQFIAALKSRGVPASVVHQRIDHNEIFGGTREELTEQTWFDARQVSLPVHQDLTDDDVSHIVNSVTSGW